MNFFDIHKGEYAIVGFSSPNAYSFDNSTITIRSIKLPGKQRYFTKSAKGNWISRKTSDGTCFIIKEDLSGYIRSPRG